MHAIWNNRELVGHASTLTGATRQLRRLLTIPAGFYLHVWFRTDLVQTVCELPAGIVFSVSNSPQN